jgi:hypothetical protein
MRRGLLTIAAWLVTVAAAAAASTAVHGRVTDPDGLALPGVSVTLISANGPVAMATTDQAGEYHLDVASGRYRLRAELPGFQPVLLPSIPVGTEPVVADVKLSLQSFTDQVTVSAQSDLPLMGDTQPDGPATVTREVIDSAMLPNSQYDDVLTLMPNVVRGPDGLISVAGARASSGALLVNGINDTDPLTGAAGVMLPIDAVDSAQVYSGGYPADLGRATGGVTAVRMRSGTDHLHMTADSLFPRLLFANGTVHGVKYWDPNAGVSGPILKGRLFFEEAVSYRYDRNGFETLAGPQMDKFTTLMSWSQLDAQLSPGQHLVATLSFDPQSTDRANITAFTVAASVPRLNQGGSSASLSDRLIIGGSSSLDLHASMMRTRLSVAPNGAGVYEVGHDLTRGSYYDDLALRGTRIETGSSYVLTPSAGHTMKIGGTLGRASLDGTNSSAPADLVRSDGSSADLITFLPERAPVAAATNEIGAFVQDTWTALPWLTLDAGIRYDRVSAAAEAALSPRLAWTIKPNGGMTISGSAGLFADKLVLAALAFPYQPTRVVQAFDVNGAALGRPVAFGEALAGPLRTPRATRWDIGLDQHVANGWQVRVKYQERHGRDELVINPEILSPTSGLLTLGNSGTSTSKSLETTIGYRAPASRHEIYASYVRARSTGDLNSFDLIDGAFKEPFVQPNQTGPLPVDVPNRLLAWGVLHLPSRLTVAPFAEIRDGFPYSAINEDWTYAGAPNSYRLPWYGALDLYVNKIVGLPGRLPDARVGLKIYNIAAVHNGRDVQRDIARADFGATYNATPRDFSFTFELLWGHR